MNRITAILLVSIAILVNACDKKDEKSNGGYSGNPQIWMKGGGYVYEYLEFYSSHGTTPVYWNFGDGYYSYNIKGTHKFRDTGTYYVTLGLASDTTIHSTQKTTITIGAVRMQIIGKWLRNGTKTVGGVTNAIPEEWQQFTVNVKNDNLVELPANDAMEATSPLELSLDKRIGDHYRYKTEQPNDTAILVYVPEIDSISIQRTRTVGNTTYQYSYQSEKY